MKKRKVKIKSVAVAVMGLDHRANNVPCQDSVRSLYISNCERGIALSDGAGSARHSDVGSDIVVTQILHYVSKHFNQFEIDAQKCKEQLIAAITREISVRCQGSATKLSDYAATAIFAYAKITDGYVNFVIGNLGDGLVIRSCKGVAQLELGPENAEYANQTWFVTNKDAVSRFRIKTGRLALHDTPGWLLSTDGAAPFLYSPRTERCAPATSLLLEELRTSQKHTVETSTSAFLSNRIIPRTGDDCSIGLIQTDVKSQRVTRRIQGGA